MAFYNKPSDVRYVDMAIYIDEHVNDDKPDDDKIFEYLYHLAKMLAYKKRFFYEAATYDDFAIHLASKIFMRLRNTRLSPVKSCLNYMKRVLYPEKVIFEREHYKENVLSDNSDIMSDTFKDTLVQMTDDLKIITFKKYFDDIPRTVRAFIEKLPNKGPAELNNIYTSCMLSILSSITLSKQNLVRLDNLIKSNKLTDAKLERIYELERENSKIYYHIEPTQKPLIDVLVNELRHIISADLSLILNDDISCGNYMQNVLMSSVYSDLNTSSEMEDF